MSPIHEGVTGATFVGFYKRILHRLPQAAHERIEQFKQSFAVSANAQNLGLWTSAVIAGLVSVAYALVFRAADNAFHALLNSHFRSVSFVLTPMLFVVAWWIVRRFAPEASGSGIPQIMAANEMPYQGAAQVQVDNLLSLRTAGIKIVSSLLCVLGGGAIGREGPTLQISTSIFHYFGRQVRRVAPESNTQTWVVAGAAAGLASAFNTPLGGIVYAIEELGIVHFHRIRTALLSAVIISGLVAQSILGRYLYLGFPKLQAIDFPFLPVALLAGIASGVLGGFFGHILHLLVEWRARGGFRMGLLLAIGSGLIMAGLFYVTPLAAGTGIDVITGFLFRGQPPTFGLIAVRYAGTMISYLSGAAGGIFSPSLAIGATIGAWLAQVFGTQHPNLMVMLGMIGFLTGVTRTPFTSFILVLEMTDRHAAIFPMMGVALIANWSAQWTDKRSFYEHVKDRWVVPQPTRP